MDLSKRYRNVPVLEGLSFEVTEGSVYGLVGPNGAGKTTTIKILMNLLKPTSGHAEVLGKDSRLLGPQDLTRIGYVSESQEMPDWMTVGYYLSYLKPFYPTWDEGYASRLVRQFDLPPGRKIRHLSRGMWMKTALASSLAYRPQLLVLDEPFSGLDPVVREELIEGLRHNADGLTVLVSSHDLAEMESFADEIGYLDRGRLQLSEEMSSLAARFREVIVSAGELVLPCDDQWPSNWLRREQAAGHVRFVESRFDPERTVAEVRRLFGEEPPIAVNRMPLRAIFVTLARFTAQGK